MNKKATRIIFMGTPNISARVLHDLIESGYNIVALIAQMDKPVGRKNELRAVPTKEVANQFGIQVYQPLKIRENYDFVKALKPDVIVTFSYGQIIPQGMLDIPTHGCINLHASLLPKYRGAAPIQRALINGETMTGVTLMEMVAAMDAGKMYAKELVTIDSDDDYTSLRSKIADAASRLILRTLPDYIDGKLVGESQDDKLVSLASKILPENEHLSIEMPVKNLLNWIRALSDEPGGYFYLNGTKVKIYKAHHLSDTTKGALGEIDFVDDQIVVQAKDGQFVIDELQVEGKNRIRAKSFINGHRNLAHTKVN
ncbi:MAG: methionyl-tRNA formyltransferase [Bacilli bacterium]|jgi:methionyl-tRNA formyltransferase